MKKKMLFICAAGLLTASIASAIESANIVGYQKFKGQAGTFRFLAPTFTDVLPVGDLEISLERITGLNDQDEIQFFGTNAKSIDTLFWFTTTGMWSGYLSHGNGWYRYGSDEMPEYAGDKDLNPGDGFFIKTAAKASVTVPSSL